MGRLYRMLRENLHTTGLYETSYYITTLSSILRRSLGVAFFAQDRLQSFDSTVQCNAHASAKMQVHMQCRWKCTCNEMKCKGMQMHMHMHMRVNLQIQCTCKCKSTCTCHFNANALRRTLQKDGLKTIQGLWRKFFMWLYYSTRMYRAHKPL